MTDADVPTAWLDADDDLHRRLADLDRTTREAHAALHAAIAERAAEPLRQLIEDAAETHRRAMETHGFDRPPDAPLRPPAVLWDALTAYRRDMTDVHARFRDRLQALDLGATVGALYDEALGTIAAEAAGAPVEVVRPEPEGVVEAEAGDSVGLLARKLAERTRRNTSAAGRGFGNGLRRLSGKEPRPEEPHAQVVPLRALMEEQALVRIPRALVKEHGDLQTAVGRAVARLEGAFTEWANGLLRLESSLDRPRFHASDVFARTDEEPAPQAEAPPDEAPHVRHVRALAQTLDATLHDLEVALPPADADALDAARDTLAERVRRSGYDSDHIAQPGDGEPLAELSNNIERWSGWHRNVGRRLEVDGLLLSLRAQLMNEVERLIAGVTASVVQPMQRTAEEAAGVFTDVRAEAAAACDRLDEPAALAGAVRDVLDRALTHVDRRMLPALQRISLDRAVEEAIEAMRGRLREATAALPEHITLHTRLGPDRVGQQGHAAEVELRRIVVSTLSEEFAARLVQSADGLRQPLFNAISSAEGVRDVIQYNLETAIEELEAAAAERPSEPEAAEPEAVEPEEDPLSNARELTVDALARAEERLHQILAPLAEPWRAFVRRATETFERGWTTLHERTNTTNLVEAQFLDFKTRTRRAFVQAQAEAQRAGQRLGHLSRKWFRFGRVGARRLVQMGQAAAGLAAQSEADRQRTLDALADAGRLHTGLPLVYRRLFSFAPLTDPTLFEGRAEPLARLTELAGRWQQHQDSSAIVVTAEPGGGRTSFVNVLRAVVFADDAPVSLRLTERTGDEQAVAGPIAEALGLDVPPSFDALEARLLAPAAAADRRVCIIEGLEHLLLRAPDGLDLIERVFIFMSRTDMRVLWAGTMGLPGWRFVERAAPQMMGLVTPVHLPPFTRAQVEAALMKRHVRSGLPLVFAEPTEPSTLLARRLSKTASPEERQAVLRAEFFDGLYRASGPNLRLALLYWLRAADFEATADTLTLRPVRPLDFGFIGGFDLARSFALKALLQHGTLTLAEHDRIFRTTRAESFLIFESLHNLRLIQPATESERTTPAERRNGTGTPYVEPVREDVRYRLHPLAVAPVTGALRAKNML